MNTTTLGQIRKVLELIETVSMKQVQVALENGSLIRALRGEIESVFSEFFCTRPGLWVSNEFRERIVAKTSDAGVVRKTTCHVLPRDMTDAEVEAELPANHMWSEADVCATIANMISLQLKGENGTLLNDGHANLFYTSSCVVRVDWGADDRRWGVDTWSRDGCRWDAGGQVLSPATDA